MELEVCLSNPHMIATAKCKIPLDICLDNPDWLPLVGCSGEGYPRQVCLDFPNLITSPACEGQNCTSSVLSSYSFTSPFLYLLFVPPWPILPTSSPQCIWRFFFGNLPQISLPPPKTCMSRSVFFSFFTVRHWCTHYLIFNLSISLTAALDGYEATLFDCQDNKEFFCSRNMCEKHQFIVKC